MEQTPTPAIYLVATLRPLCRNTFRVLATDGLDNNGLLVAVEETVTK